MAKYSLIAGCKGLEGSVIDRSRISAAISNLKSATSYIKTWVGYYKMEPTEELITGIDFALNWSIKYKNEFYSVEHLANNYNELWLEKYSKAKLLFEKAEHEAELIVKGKLVVN